MNVSTVPQIGVISKAALCNWRNQDKHVEKRLPSAEKDGEQWPVEACFASIMETAILSEAVLKQRDSSYRKARERHPERWSQGKAKVVVESGDDAEPEAGKAARIANVGVTTSSTLTDINKVY